jgi:hypothetical protein
MSECRILRRGHAKDNQGYADLQFSGHYYLPSISDNGETRFIYLCPTNKYSEHVGWRDIENAKDEEEGHVVV